MKASEEPTAIICESECDISKCGWISPRASFDFVTPDIASPEKRKRCDITDDGRSSEFEFRVPCLTSGAVRVSPADELFCDGKLQPCHLLQGAGMEQNLPCFSSKKIEAENTQTLQMAPTLASESSPCSSTRLEIDVPDVLSSCTGVETSCSSSSPHSFILTITTPTSPKAVKAMNKFKDFFKFSKSQIFSGEGSEELSASSKLKKATVSRSFWPFPRSISAGERKINSSAILLSHRSNSAGESKTTSSNLLPSKDGTNEKSKKQTSKSISPCASAEYLKLDGKSSCIFHKEIHGLSLADEKEKQKYGMNSASKPSTTRTKGLGSPVRIQRKLVTRPVRNAGKGSPGRGDYTPVGRELRQSERSSANSKASIRSQNSGKQAYSNTVRLIPVLDVTACMRPLRVRRASKNSIFNYRTFFLKKEKVNFSAKIQESGG